MKSLILVLTILFGQKSYALAGLGLYSSFGTSTQKEKTGSKNTFSFDPMLSLNTIIPTNFYSHLLMPEFGYVFHSSGSDGYSKSTMLFLFDVGLPITQNLIFRYGIGTVLTRISGDGGSVEIRNGSSTATAYLPDQSSTSWNTTIDLGVEAAINASYAFRFQTYWFSLFNGESRKASYSLNVLYYL